MTTTTAIRLFFVEIIIKNAGLDEGLRPRRARFSRIDKKPNKRFSDGSHDKISDPMR